MLYAILSEDVKNSLDKRQSARPDHLARLEKLREEGYFDDEDEEDLL